MAVYLPCLSVNTEQSSLAYGVGAAINVTGGLVYALGPTVQVAFGEAALFLGLGPLGPLVAFGLTWKFWAGLFGLGETKIDRQKEEIQEVYTDIFLYLKDAYGVPIRDNHALQFDSDGVQDWFDKRPDIKAYAESQYDAAEYVARNIFADDSVGPGKRERCVNQYCANAAINRWPMVAVEAIWEGIKESALDGCSSDPNRWIHNPYAVAEAARCAVLLQYIPLQVMSDMASMHFLGSYLAERVIYEWHNNPDLVKGIEFKPNTYWWQENFINRQWATAPTNVGYFGTNLFEKEWIREITDRISFDRPSYPNFQSAGQGGLPEPTPQGDEPDPDTQPTDDGGGQDPGGGGGGGGGVVEIPTQTDFGRLQNIINRLQQTAFINAEDDAWLKSDIGQKVLKYYASVYPIPDELKPYLPGSQDDGGGGQDDGDTTQPSDPTNPDQPRPTEDPYPGEPDQADYDKACGMWVRLRQGIGLTPEEEYWLSWPRNAKAFLQTEWLEACGYTPSQPTDDGGGGQDDDCPPLPDPQPSDPPPGPQDPDVPGQDDPYDPDQDPCPSPCQAQIDELRQDQQECCDLLRYNVIPRIEVLEQWVIDIEDRLPGPPPELPQYPETPPGIPQPPPLPPQLPPETPGGPGELPPQLPPEIVECLVNLCDEEQFCAKVQECDRGVECKDLSLCDETGGPWGGMAECWLEANTPGEEDLDQSYAGQSFPTYGVNQFVYAWEKAHDLMVRQGGYGGQLPTLPDEQGEIGDYYRGALESVQNFMRAWDGGEYDGIEIVEPEIVEPEFIFADPADLTTTRLTVRQPKLRSGEVDPCTGVPEDVNEIPPAEVNP